MRTNGIERDFLRIVRHADPADCRTVISALYGIKGRYNADGDLTDLGLLTGAVIEEIAANGCYKCYKLRYGKDGGNV